MKRFYKDVAVEPVDGGFRVMLDGRPIRTQRGAPQVVPTLRLAEALADEWRSQGDEIDPKSFVLRDLADFAIDQVAPDPAAAAEPLLQAVEARHGIRLERVSGIVHRAQPAETLARLCAVLGALDPFTLAALETLTRLAASLTIGLLALEPEADPDALFAASNCEQDWQAELWGWEWQAEEDRARRLEAFRKALAFARLASD